jgi:hypothetical protein
MERGPDAAAAAAMNEAHTGITREQRRVDRGIHAGECLSHNQTVQVDLSARARVESVVAVSRIEFPVAMLR